MSKIKMVEYKNIHTGLRGKPMTEEKYKSLPMSTRRLLTITKTYNQPTPKAGSLVGDPDETDVQDANKNDLFPDGLSPIARKRNSLKSGKKEQTIGGDSQDEFIPNEALED